MMQLWKEQLALVESDAMRIERLEADAESRFDQVHAAAEASGDVAQARRAPELQDWLAARKDTDAAWSRWAQVMDAKPKAHAG